MARRARRQDLCGARVQARGARFQLDRLPAAPSRPTIAREAPADKHAPRAQPSASHRRGRACVSPAPQLVRDDDEFEEEAFGGGVSHGAGASSSAVVSSFRISPAQSFQSLQPVNWRLNFSAETLDYIAAVTRYLPTTFMDNAIDFGAHDEATVLTRVYRRLEALPPGTVCTAGICGTDHGCSPPAIVRCRVYPNSGHYPAVDGWDFEATEALVVGVGTLSDAALRRIEIKITTKINAMPSLSSVAPSEGGQGPHTVGPVRVLYLNRLKEGLTMDDLIPDVEPEDGWVKVPSGRPAPLTPGGAHTWCQGGCKGRRGKRGACSRCNKMKTKSKAVRKLAAAPY